MLAHFCEIVKEKEGFLES